MRKVKIFIASSAEVKAERNECILHINQVNKSHKHLDLEAVEWEYDLPKGGYPDFETVQEAINPILEGCAISVFIFHSKLGTYTQQEFELVETIGMKHFVFFKAGFSPKNKKQIETYARLIDFKEGLNETVLYEEYLDTSKFGELLKDNLHLYLSRQFPVTTAPQNVHLSDDIKTVLKILTEKQEEIDELKSNQLALANSDTQNKLKSLPASP
ncbi:MAG: hypothetical protein AAF466_07315 [Bacteroidota bacterium]